jgi:hypothetical protein
MKSLNVNMNYVSCFLLCVILILMVVCCCKKPTESFAEWKCIERGNWLLKKKCLRYKCKIDKNPSWKKWRKCGDNFCTKKNQYSWVDRKKRIEECIMAKPAAAPGRASSPTPWLELSHTELQNADILLNFLTLISGRIYSEQVLIHPEQVLIHEDWQILTESLINNVKLIVNGNRGEDFFEYLMHGQNDPFAMYNGNVLFKKNTFGKNVLTAGRWNNLKTTAPTEEQEIILNQVSSYMDYWTSGQRGQNYVRPTLKKDVFGNYL